MLDGADLKNFFNTKESIQSHVSKGHLEETAEQTQAVHRADALESHEKQHRAMLERGTALTNFGKSFVMSSPAILVFAYNRPDYLQKTLKSLSLLQTITNYVLYVSQDGHDAAVRETVRSFSLTWGTKMTVVHWERERIPAFPRQDGQAYLTQHYKYALDRVFVEYNHSHCIIVEDDMIFSPDFLLYFEKTAHLLEADPSIWCISSWNDNAYRHFEWDASRLFRNSWFPGLGWMLRRQLWEELGPKFPKMNWDHWMRANHRGRDCICPEVSRNYNIGKHGANLREDVYEKYFSTLMYNTRTNISFGDLSYLLQPNYEHILEDMVTDAELLEDLASAPTPKNKQSPVAYRGRTFLVPFQLHHWDRVASQLQIWQQQRTHYQGTHIFRYQGIVYIIANVRISPVVPVYLKITSNPTLTPTIATAGVSCTKACEAVGLKCLHSEFEFLNDCLMLEKYFPCERGCHMSFFDYQPSYYGLIFFLA